MRFFWKILSNIYSELVIGGALDITPPKFLFNKPAKKLERYSQEIILADKTFTPKERELLIQSVKDLEYFCNGMIEIILIFDLDPEDQERITGRSVFLKVGATHPSIVEMDEKIKAQTLGLCEYMDDETRRLYLVHERLKDSVGFRTTAIHELGHFIGMDHTAKPSIMHKHNSRNILYPTYKDALELAHIWGQHPNDFCYFIL